MQNVIPFEVSLPERLVKDADTLRICEAVGCYEAATEAIIVSAGKFGAISLYLCHNCSITKFQSTIKQTQIDGTNKNG